MRERGRCGHEPTLIEKAPRLRTGGYAVDFWGGGYAVAERMGLTPELHAAGYAVQELRLVDRHSRKVGGFSAELFRRNLDGRFVTLPRGDLAAMIHRSLDDRVETLFGESVSAIAQDDAGALVTFERGQSRPLLAGEGTGLAMVEAYVLAGDLSRAGADHREAFRRYERRLRPIVEARQRSARAFASMFAPKTSLGLWTRNQASKLLDIPWVAGRIVGREFHDDIGLPEYVA